MDEALTRRDSIPVFVQKEVISDSCSDIACRMFHEYTKYVESVFFIYLKVEVKGS